MADIKIADRLGFLRRQKGLTQEEFANVIGVTNQAVSKWEGGLCCPDIALLPDIAAYYGVSVDELLGYRPVTGINEVGLRIRQAFENCNEDDVFDLAYKLCLLLHEGVVSRGYRADHLPWTPRQRTDLEFDEWAGRWGYSACVQDRGATAAKAGLAFFMSARYARVPSSGEIKALFHLLEPLAREAVLKALFALYELTAAEESGCAGLERIAEKSGLTPEAAREALNMLPVREKRLDGGQIGYWLEGRWRIVAPLMALLTYQ